MKTLMSGAGKKIYFCPPAKEAYAIVERFENEFKSKINVKHCVAVNSGYSALFLGFKALGIGPGDEVIMGDFTMIACANAVHECGAKPIFVDVLDNGNIDPTKIKTAITKRTKAILAVHIYGHPCDMDEINRIARAHKLYVVEDCAEAHGAKYKSKFAGEMSDLAAFSFYSNKIISTGEGGAVVTNNTRIAEKVRMLRSYNFSHGYSHDGIGYGMRMNPYGAIQGIKMLKSWSKFVQARRKIANWYNSLLSDKFVKPSESRGYTNVYWMYGIRVREGYKNLLRSYLANKGIETRDYFVPMRLQAAYRGPKLRNSTKLSRTGVLLPSMPSLTRQDVMHIANTINEFYH